jgi:hypothetical protein
LEEKLEKKAKESKMDYIEGFKAGVQQKPSKTMNTLINNYNPSTLLQCVPTKNLVSLTDDHVKFSLLEYTYEDFMLGFEGVVNFFIFLTTGEQTPADLTEGFVSSYYCTEDVRQTFYRYVEGWIKDPKGEYINTVLDIMRPYAEEYYTEFLERMSEGISEEISEEMSVEMSVETDVFDAERGKVYPVYVGICGGTLIERNKLTNKIRSALARMLRVNTSLSSFIIPQIGDISPEEYI